MFDTLFSRSGLSLDRLRSFVELSEAGSISKAASGDPSRQALISRQIRELEEFFGTELTLRRGKTLVLSPAGQRLAILIREQFQDLDDFQREQQNQAKSFSLGAGASILEWLVIPAAFKIRRALSLPTLQLASHRSGQLIELIRDGRLDFAIVREDAIPEGLPRLEILKVKFYLGVSRRLVGSQLKSRLDEASFLSSLPFAANAGGGQLDRIFRKAMIEKCGHFQPAFECDSLLQIRELIVRGMGVGLLPSIGIQGLAEDDVLLREFAPMKDYGRALALHWNERQMRRRGVEESVIRDIAKVLIKPFSEKQCQAEKGRILDFMRLRVQ
jgi:DNA-binding transcriptional LysR family regulator